VVLPALAEIIRVSKKQGRVTCGKDSLSSSCCREDILSVTQGKNVKKKNCGMITFVAVSKMFGLNVEKQCIFECCYVFSLKKIIAHSLQIYTSFSNLAPKSRITGLEFCSLTLHICDFS
jgi:hypothetical protein